VRRTIGKILGYALTGGLKPAALIGLVLGAFILAAAAAAFGAAVWPKKDDPAYAPPGCPDVRLVDGRLVFDPPTAYLGGPGADGRRRLGADQLSVSPSGPPAAPAKNGLGLSPDGVVLSDSDGRTIAFTPAAYVKAERGLAALMFSAVFLSAFPLFAFAARLLFSARFGRRNRPSALKTTLRAFVPALIAAAATSLVFPANRPPFATLGALFAVAGANLLFGVADGAPPPPQTSKSSVS